MYTQTQRAQNFRLVLVPGDLKGPLHQGYFGDRTRRDK